MAETETRERGRPRRYEDHKSFDDKVQEYFAHCDETGRIPTKSGISLFLGFADKQSFSQYREYGDDFSLTVSMAELKMEDDRNQLLLSKEKFTPGVQLDLRANFGWVDKSTTVFEDPKGNNPFDALMAAVQGQGRPKPGDQS